MGVSKGTGMFGGWNMRDIQATCPKVTVEVSASGGLVGRDKVYSMVVIQTSSRVINAHSIKEFVAAYSKADKEGLL